MGSRAVCSISLNTTDRIRLIGVPPQLTDGIRDAILAAWQQQIKGERNYYGAHEFRLKGGPWRGRDTESVSVILLICGILSYMAKSGWNLVQSIDISKKPDDKDTMFFESARQDSSVQIFALSFNKGDRIRLIGAKDLMPHLKKTVQNYWQRGIQGEKEYKGSLELKLHGNPWYAEAADAVFARGLLNQIMSSFRSVGFKLYGSIDVSMGSQRKASGKSRKRDDDDEDEDEDDSRGESGYELDSLFFRKVGPSWS